MTSLDAPPISVGTRVEHRLRSQDIFFVPATAAVEVPVAPDEEMLHTGQINITGHGHTVKRLWIYGPDNTWIPLPVGAGNDEVLRSFNVYLGDGTWSTPVQGRPMYQRGQSEHYASNKFQALMVRAPGRTWPSMHVNPQTFMNEPTGTPNAGFSPERYTALGHGNNGKYILLSNMWKRPDPTWREVPLTQPIPDAPPTQYAPSYHFLDPIAGVHVHTSVSDFDNYKEDPDDEPITSTGDTFRALGVDDFLNRFNSSNVSAARVTINHYKYPPDPARLTLYREHNEVVQSFAMLDLQAIRRQLTDKYNESIFHVGQYRPMEDMLVKRVIFEGNVQITIAWSWQLNGLDSPATNLPGVDNIRVMFYANTNVPTDFINDGETPYSPRYPTDMTPSGRLWWDQQTVPRSGGALTIYQPFTLVMEGPGENQIGFGLDVSGLPELWSTTKQYPITGESYPYPWYMSCFAEARLTRADIHYAVPGHDVLGELIELEQNTGVWLGNTHQSG